MRPGSLASRTAALGVLGLVAGLVYLAAVAPLLDRLAAYDAAIVELNHQLSQYARIASSRNQIEGQIADLRAAMPLEEDLLAGGTDAIAGANLQALLQDLAVEHGGGVTSARPSEPELADTLQKIGVEITLVMTIDALQAMLYRIEAGRPLLFVDTLRVRAGEAGAVMFDVDLAVHGFRRVDGP